jgi:hypothetical protein
MKLPFGLYIGRDKPNQAEEDANSYAMSVVDAAISTMLNWLELSDTRKDIYTDIDRMVDSDEYVAEAIDSLVSDILPLRNLWDPFIAVDTEDERLKARIEDILDRSRVLPEIRNIIHHLLRYHNTYLEFCIDKQNRFHHAQHIPDAWSIYRNTDRHGNLKNGIPGSHKAGVCAYDQRDDSGKVLAEFYPYQIIHLRCPPFDKKGYGVPFLKAARRNWIRLQVLEDHMAIARIVRAYLKLVHYVPVPSEATPRQIKKALAIYKDSITKKEITGFVDTLLTRLKKAVPSDVGTDFFLPQPMDDTKTKADIKPIDPANAQLQNVKDLEYSLNRGFSRLKVPKARLANEGDVRAKATMTEINTAYAGTLVGYQLDILMPITDMVNRALILEGVPVYNKTKVDYKLVLPSPFVRDDLTRAKIDHIESIIYSTWVKNNVLSREYVRKQGIGLTDEEDVLEVERIEQELEKYPAPAAGFGLAASKVLPHEDILKELTNLRQAVENNGHRSGAIYRH